MSSPLRPDDETRMPGLPGGPGSHEATEAAAATCEPAVPLPDLIAAVYREAPHGLRRRLLECLLRPVGPLALATIAAGAFGCFLPRLPTEPIEVSVEAAAGISTGQFLELARFVEQCRPEVFVQLGCMLAGSAVEGRSSSGALFVRVAHATARRDAVSGAGGA